MLKTSYCIELKDDVTPVIVPPRKIPVALKNRLKEELTKMEDMGVIEKVEKATDWVNALVVAEKPNGKLRICLDPRPLNKAIKRQHYRLPTSEEIFSMMTGAQVFSKIDASNGYWQIPVDERSSDLLTFATVFGRYKFKRMPFGIHSASEIFQREMGKVIADIDGAVHSQDDIIIWGRNNEEHDYRLFQVLDRIRESGLKMNKSKCVFRVPEVVFLGNLLSKDGVKPDPKKVEAIVNMQVPENKVELQRYLGMVNYLGKFVANLSHETATLRELLKKDTIFCMGKPQIETFHRLRNIITKAPILQFYNSELPVRIRSDSSMFGLGAMLEQLVGNDWKPVAFASRRLDSAEQNYAQIERETLSVLFACERFHEYIYGREVIVQNDHKPLKTIFSKSIVSCPPRIQRFFLRLQKYDFKFEYAPGKTMKVADTLSRSCVPGGKPEFKGDVLAYHVHSVISNLPISNARLKQMQIATEKDDELLRLKCYTVEGWPAKDYVDPNLRPYYSQRDEIVIHEGLLLKGQRIIVPKLMRPEVKKLLHQGHPGVEKCKLRARQTVYWPGLSKELEDVVLSYSSCIDYRSQQKNESPIPHDVPDEPWVKVAVDIFTIYGVNYLIVIDYYSKYFEIMRLNEPIDSPEVVKVMKKLFSRHGIPKIVFSDGGPQFSAAFFGKFSKEWDFEHTFSSPHYPQSNGLVERKIQTVKKVLKKAHDANEDLYLSLLMLNNTPGKSSDSPAQLMYKRIVRTTLPSMKKKVPEQVTKPVSNERNQRDLPDIDVGQSVRLRTPGQKDWKEKGKILTKCVEPRSYNVIKENGRLARRNRRHLIPTNEKVVISSEDYTEQPVVGEPEVDRSRVGDVPNSQTELPKERLILQDSRDQAAKLPVTSSTRSGRTIKRPMKYNDFEM